MNRESIKKLQNIKFIARNEYEKSFKSQIQMKKNTPIFNEIKNLPQNPFDVNRHDLLPTLKTMKEGFLKAIDISNNKGQFNKENIVDNHSVPISKMGDYHQAETKIQYFRDVFQDEETTKWLQKIMFGNPFLKYKKERELSIDEADEAQQTMDEANSNLSSSSSVSSLSSTSSTSSSSSILGILRRTRKRSYIPENPFNISKIPKLNSNNENISIPSSLNIPTPIEKWRNETALILNSVNMDKNQNIQLNNLRKDNIKPSDYEKIIEDKSYDIDNNVKFNNVELSRIELLQEKNINKKNNIPGLQYSNNINMNKNKENNDNNEDYELEDGEVQEEGEINEESENISLGNTNNDDAITISSNDKIMIDNIVNDGEINQFLIKLKEYIDFRNACSIEIRKFGKDYDEDAVKKLLSGIKKTNVINQIQKQKLFNYCYRLAIGFKNKKLISYLKTKFKI